MNEYENSVKRQFEDINLGSVERRDREGNEYDRMN